MDEKELDQIQAQLLKAIDDDVRAEKEIDEVSSSLSAQLLLGGKCLGVVDDTEYEFIYRKVKFRQPTPDNATAIATRMILIASNRIKQRITGGKYIPYQCAADYDIRYTEIENLKAVIEAFVRHQTGRIKPEMQE
jgi:hypothetical protein